MTTRVWRALRLVGSRKAATPLEMASRPVSEEPPLANDRRRMMNAAPYSRRPGAAWVPDGHRSGWRRSGWRWRGTARLPMAFWM